MPRPHETRLFVMTVAFFFNWTHAKNKDERFLYSGPVFSIVFPIKGQKLTIAKYHSTASADKRTSSINIDIEMGAGQQAQGVRR